MFASLAMLIAFCTLLCFGAAKLHIYEQPAKSDLEGREWDEIPKVSATSLLNESFQANLEDYISHLAPAHDGTVIAFAAAQREAIGIAGLPFKYNVRPTFYGSKYITDQDAQMLFPLPTKIDDSRKSQKQRDAWIQTINEAKRNHPDTRFVVAQITEPGQSESNPGYNLSNKVDLIDSQFVENKIISDFDDGITAFCEPIENIEEFQTSWFSTDLHWTIKRASRAYNKIASCLELKPYAYDDAEAVQIIDSWYGDIARKGIDLEFHDTLTDMPLDCSQLSFFKTGKSVKKGRQFNLGLREQILSGKTSSDDLSRFNAYSQYYSPKSAIIENAGENNGKTLLLVGDSYSYCLKRLFATNYKTTVAIHPGNSSVNRSMESLFEEYHFDDVVVITQCQKYLNIADYSPEFIGLSQ